MALDTIPKQEGGKLKAVASGTLPSGQPVVVNSDGTVSVVAESTESADQSLGLATTFESANSQDMAATYDPDQDKVVIVYQDNTNSLYGTAIIGTVSDTSISFGTPTVFNSANTYQIATAYDASAQKAVVFYSDDGNSSYGTGIVGTVSGTSISFGSETVFESATTYWISCAYDANAQKTVVAYRDSGNSLYGTSIVATVSGTSISFGSPVVFNSGSTYETSATYDSTAQKVVISYADNNNSGRGTAIVGTVSGTSISFGSAGVFNSGRSEQSSIAYDANADKVVVAYRQDSNGYCLANVGTVSGTSISFGSSATVNAASSEYISTVYDSNAEKVVVCYRDNGNSNRGRFNVGTVSGTSISFAGEQLFEAGATWHIGSTYDSTAKRVIIVYGDEGDSYYGKAIVLQNAFSRTTSNLTSENYIGMSTGGAVADTGNATIDIVGTVNKEQSGLTPGQQYYVQTDGAIGTTPASPSVLAGTAVSATKMVVKS